MDEPERIDRVTLGVLDKAYEDPNILWEYILDLLLEKHPETATDEGLARFLASLPRGLQIVYWLVVADGEILNGGIGQVFCNHSNWEIEEMVGTLKAIGASETADHVKRAAEILKVTEVPDDEDAATLHAITQVRCTEEASRRDWDLLVAYMRKHPHQFLHG